MSDDTDKKPTKPRFKERDDADDADDDDDDDAPPRKKKRAAADDGPRVAGSERTPVLMLAALLGSAVALLACCVGGGWWSFGVLVGGGDGFVGNEFEVTGANRQDENVRLSTPTINWYLVTLRPIDPKNGRYFVVMRSDGKTAETEITERYAQGATVYRTGTRYPELKGTSSATEVYVERRTPNGAVMKVSNYYLAR
jgi:hypothetical protein